MVQLSQEATAGGVDRTVGSPRSELANRLLSVA